MAIDLNGATCPGNFIVFAWLMGASVVATVAMSPALLFLLVADESVAPVPFMIAFAVANILVSGVAIAIGLRLETKVGMGVPLLRSWLAGDQAMSRPIWAILRRCFVLGFGLAVTVVACGLAFRSQLPALPDDFVFPPVWQGILMMLGAAVREEILFRLFAVNLFTWIGMKADRQQSATPFLIWVVNLFVALLFAWMHLIVAAPLLKLNAIATGGAVALGTLAGALLGWVYWRHGLLMAMCTHAVAGVLIYLGARSLIALLS